MRRDLAEFDEVCQELQNLIVPDNASETHTAVVRHLEKSGFSCQVEYPVADRGDGRRGLIDILAQRGELRIGIEIDKARPRGKSVYKLNQVHDAFKLILLRREYTGTPPAQVDRVLSLRTTIEGKTPPIRSLLMVPKTPPRVFDPVGGFSESLQNVMNALEQMEQEILSLRRENSRLHMELDRILKRQ